MTTESGKLAHASIPGIERLDALVILGSGMSGCYLPDEYEILHDAGGSDLPGHTGKLALLESTKAVALVSLGRRHLYQGYHTEEVTALIAEAARLGARTLIVTNAAGALNPRYEVGEIMLIESCLGMMLGGKGMMRDGRRSRLLDGRLPEGKLPEGRLPEGRLPEGRLPEGRLPEAFAVEHYREVEDRALRRGVALHRGIYAGVLGPSYETRAEIRMLRRLGADVVGMSTVPEAAAARALGMRAVGLSLITNVLTDTEKVGLDHSHVVEQGKRGEIAMRAALDAALETFFDADDADGGCENVL